MACVADRRGCPRLVPVSSTAGDVDHAQAIPDPVAVSTGAPTRRRHDVHIVFHRWDADPARTRRGTGRHGCTPASGSVRWARTEVGLPVAAGTSSALVRPGCWTCGGGLTWRAAWRSVAGARRGRSCGVAGVAVRGHGRATVRRELPPPDRTGEVRHEAWPHGWRLVDRPPTGPRLRGGHDSPALTGVSGPVARALRCPGRWCGSVPSVPARGRTWSGVPSSGRQSCPWRA
jgi:hypothetical protein